MRDINSMLIQLNRYLKMRKCSWVCLCVPITVVVFTVIYSGCKPAEITEYVTWENSIGMQFIDVIELEGIRFSVFPVRVRDFRKFVDDHLGNDGYDYYAGEQPGVLTSEGWGEDGWNYTWDNPNFTQSDDHPVVCVSWEDAQAFCKWLTHKERREQTICQCMEYRLPTRWEWSVAMGLTRGPQDEPQENPDFYYFWGKGFPPPANWGNFAGEEAIKRDWPSEKEYIRGYRDNHARTSPVGAYGARRGLSDMGSNVFEWGEDYFDPIGKYAVFGASWACSHPLVFRSNARLYGPPSTRDTMIGFRIILSPVTARCNSDMCGNKTSGFPQK